MRHAITLVALLAALLLPGCATNPVTGDQDFVLMSEQQELDLGKEYNQQVLKQYDKVDDPALQDYVQRIGQELAAVSHRSDIPYHFTVLDSTEVNAFALPGGYVYITRGILGYFNSEAELAGVLGHEIGHVTARHSVRQYSAATASSILGTILLAQAGGGQAAADLFQTVQLAAMRGYGRDQELQADRLGAQYLARAGYDSDAMMDVIRLLSDQEQYEVRQAKKEGREPNTYHGVFATHPDNDERLKTVIRAAKKYQAPNARPDGHAEYLRHIDGLTFGPGTKQGVVEHHAFLHRELDTGLRAPDDWTIVNQPQQLVFQAPGDQARMVVTMGQADGKRAPRELLAAHLSGANMADAHTVSAGPLPGYTGIATQRTKLGDRRVRHAVVRKGDQAWYFAGVTREGDAFQRYDDAFMSIIRSLHALSPAERERAAPLHINVITAAAGTRYEDLARRAPERVENPAARLRLLNGDWPRGEPAAGRLMKVLQ